MAREKAASSISVKDFDSNTDDFDEWIELFEDSVVLATNPQTTARRHELYLKWLKQKLDAPARAVLKQIPAGTAYASVGDVKGVKEQLQELLIDPHAVYKWQAMKTKITWDQKESFQELATRVKRAVDKYDKDLDDASKKRAYFFRFREALPKVYRNGIDVACRKDERTLENAKEIALAVQMTQDEEGAALTGAAMADDRVHGLELDMAEVKTKMGNLELAQKAGKERKTSKEHFFKSRSKPPQTDSSDDVERDYREYRKFRSWQAQRRKDRDRRNRNYSDSSRDSGRDGGRRRRDNGRDLDRSLKEHRSSGSYGNQDNRRGRDHDDKYDSSSSSSSEECKNNSRKDRQEKVTSRDKDSKVVVAEGESSTESSENTESKRGSKCSKRRGKSTN